MNTVFDNPPVSEVVVATYFAQPIAEFRNQHVGLFWSRIKDQFPISHQQLPVAISADVSPGEPFPMPRYWFVAKDETTLIQLQKNAFIFNWRRRGNNRYPHFNQSIKPEFDRLYSELESFLVTDVGAPALSIDLCELTYVNTVEQCDYWTGPYDTAKVIPSFTAVSSGTENDAPSDFSCFYTYRVDRDLHLGVTVRSAVAPQPSNKPVLVFEIKASTRLGGSHKSTAYLWFGRAHSAVFRCFLNITGEQIQYDYWGRREEAL